MMSQRIFLTRNLFSSLAVLATSIVCLLAPSAYAAPDAYGAVISLPAPDKEGGIPLMQALAKRKSGESFKAAALPPQELSNMLWAAFGITREDGRRTVPTAMNKQNMQIYAAMEGGIWRYEAQTNQLNKVSDTDMRAVFKAPLTLIYAGEGDFAALHAGSLVQNVGLYCASAGLANRVKVTGVEEARKAVSVPEGYKVVIIQNVGYPE